MADGTPKAVLQGRFQYQPPREPSRWRRVILPAILLAISGLGLLGTGCAEDPTAYQRGQQQLKQDQDLFNLTLGDRLARENTLTLVFIGFGGAAVFLAGGTAIGVVYYGIQQGQKARAEAQQEAAKARQAAAKAAQMQSEADIKAAEAEMANNAANHGIGVLSDPQRGVIIWTDPSGTKFAFIMGRYVWIDKEGKVTPLDPIGSGKVGVAAIEGANRTQQLIAIRDALKAQAKAGGDGHSTLIDVETLTGKLLGSPSEENTG